MPNYGAEIICPFFVTLYDNKNSYRIVCEGAEGGINTILQFHTKQAMNEWRYRYCLTFHYGFCPYAGMIQKQYEQEDIQQ